MGKELLASRSGTPPQQVPTNIATQGSVTQAQQQGLPQQEDPKAGDHLLPRRPDTGFRGEQEGQIKLIRVKVPEFSL